MHFNSPKKLFTLTALLLCLNIVTLNLQDSDFRINTPIDLMSLNFTYSNEYGSTTFSTVAYEDHALVNCTFHNSETNEITEETFRLDYDSFSDIHKSNGFDCQLPTHYESSQSCRIDTTDYFHDHLKDSAREQRQQDNHGLLTENYRYQTIQSTDIIPILDKIYIKDNFTRAIEKDYIKSYFQWLLCSFTYQYRKKADAWFTSEKKLLQAQAKIDFINGLLSGQITHYLEQIQHGDLIKAEEAFSELKELWPWNHTQSFFNPTSYCSDELKFLTRLRVNVMKMAERELITRSDYIAKYSDQESLQAIQRHITRCISLQQTGNRTEFFNEFEKFSLLIKKERKKENFVTIICSGLTSKFLFDPITTQLHNIVHAPSLKEAQYNLESLEIEIAKQIEQNNIILTSDAEKYLIEQYGFDLRDAAHTCYKSRPDYVNIPENQTIFSDPVHCVLSNIQNANLHMAYTEVIHFQQQIAQGLTDLNITDPTAQKEFIIEDFGQDVLEVIHKAYTQRPDHINIVNHFIPLEVQKITAEILENNYSYLAVAQEFNKVADQILDNAKLCQLECVPQVEDQILDSLQIIQEPKNNAEFIFHTTVVDHLLTDLQSQSTAVVEGKPINWERATNLLGIALGQFISRLNPITQAEDLGSLFIGAGYLLDSAANKALDKIIEEIHDPIGTSKQYVESTVLACQYIIDTARFTCDTISGAYYLSSEERSQRLQNYCKNAKEIYRHIESQVTAEQIAAATGHILGDFVFGLGVSSTAIFLKEIDAFGKISNEAKVIAQGLKSAIEEHPSFVTAEGIVLKMSDKVKDVGKAAKTIHASIVDSEFVRNLKSIGDNIWQSPAGLIYKPDKKFGNRINHVLAHAKPNLAKNHHTVFNIPENEILKLLDEAWSMRGEPLASDVGVYIINMKRIVGVNGESAIRIVTIPGTTEILTAYPVKL